MNTLRPDYLKQLLVHASKQRYGKEGEKAESELIYANDKFMDILSSMPYKSKKKGKTLFLLKNSSKPHAGGKKRKKVEIIGTLEQYEE